MPSLNTTRMGGPKFLSFSNQNSSEKMTQLIILGILLLLWVLYQMDVFDTLSGKDTDADSESDVDANEDSDADSESESESESEPEPEPAESESASGTDAAATPTAGLLAPIAEIASPRKGVPFTAEPAAPTPGFLEPIGVPKPTKVHQVLKEKKSHCGPKFENRTCNNGRFCSTSGWCSNSCEHAEREPSKFDGLDIQKKFADGDAITCIKSTLGKLVDGKRGPNKRTITQVPWVR